MAAALASRPEVGSSMNMIEGLATSSTAIVNLFLCSVDRPAHYLLQEVSRSLALWALEPTGLKELDHVLPWALVHDLAFRQEDDVVEEIERLRSGLEEGHQYGVLG
ncbi:hypothetical protein RJ639_003520 [Escallonia herrerae]|uniref:Uncharacterized protein n=1 Tax=Escallonia herrerae TaxID=1293975 RepID=A0AA88W3Y0_9ASTE|nr:hypothetical protein RJ639_003520 [Escallonia herrerae]